jgi:hypothetical protein
VKWQDVELANPAPYGYAPSSGPIGETLTSLVKRLGEGRRPALVYLRNGKNGPGKAAIEENFRDEKVCIALERFLCLRADLKSLPDGKQREKLRQKTPALFFFDPAGKPVFALSGRRAASPAALSSLVKKLWKASFTLSLRSYTKQKDDILDRLTRIDRMRESVQASASRAEGKTAKVANLNRDIEELEGLMLAVRRDDGKLAKSVRLREKYRSR